MLEDGIRPLVSVVIPCHDQAGVLADTVRSASARHVRVEIIVVDDGSTDHTVAVTQGLDDVRLIRQGHRGGVAARNRGLRAASGDFVIVLEAGDRLLPGAVDAAVRELALHPACAMAYGRAATFDDDGHVWPAADAPIVRSGHHAALLQTNVIGMSAIAIFRRTALTAAGGFAEGAGAAADYDLYLRVSRDAPIHDHGLVVAARRRSGGVSPGHALGRLRDTLAVMHRNRPGGHSELHSAWSEGYRRWQDFYGTQIVEDIREHVHERSFFEACRMALALTPLAPWVLLRELRHVRVRPPRRAAISARLVR